MYVVYEVFGNGQIIYVGISIDMLRRFKEHKKYSEWWKLKDHIKYVFLPNSFEAEKLEDYLIHKYSPQYNIWRRKKYDPNSISIDENRLEWKIFDESTLTKSRIKKQVKNGNNEHAIQLENKSIIEWFIDNESNITKIFYDKDNQLKVMVHLNNPYEDKFKNIQNPIATGYKCNLENNIVTIILADCKNLEDSAYYDTFCELVKILRNTGLMRNKYIMTDPDEERIESIEKCFQSLYQKSYKICIRNIFNNNIKRIKPASLILNLQKLVNEGQGNYIFIFPSKQISIFYTDFIEIFENKIEERNEWLQEWAWFRKKGDRLAFVFNTQMDYLYFLYLIMKFHICYSNNYYDSGHPIQDLTYDDLTAEKIVQQLSV